MNERWGLITVGSWGGLMAAFVKSALSSSDTPVLSAPWLLAHESGYDKPFAKCHGHVMSSARVCLRFMNCLTRC